MFDDIDTPEALMAAIEQARANAVDPATIPVDEIREQVLGAYSRINLSLSILVVNGIIPQEYFDLLMFQVKVIAGGALALADRADDV